MAHWWGMTPGTFRALGIDDQAEMIELFRVENEMHEVDASEREAQRERSALLRRVQQRQRR